MNTIVYWLHLKKHKNPFKEGYVGITTNIERRLLEHFRNAKKNELHIHKAINKYGKENIICSVLHENISKKTALSLEEYYRPKKQIGWNESVGGIIPANIEERVIIKYFHVSSPNIEYSGYTNEIAEKLNIKASAIRQFISRKHNTYNNNGWHFIHENTDKTTIKTQHEIRSKRMKEMMTGRPNVRKGKKVWSEEQKKKIGDFHRGKKISQEQIEIVRIKNRESHPKCKPVYMKHKDSDKIYYFHSISEASRQLHLPLYRLKSKHTRPKNRYGKDGWAIIDEPKDKQEVTNLVKQKNK